MLTQTQVRVFGSYSYITSHCSLHTDVRGPIPSGSRKELFKCLVLSGEIIVPTSAGVDISVLSRDVKC